MNENNQKNEYFYGEEIIGWSIPEYEKKERSKKWYIIAIIISLFLLIYSYFTDNFLFAVIIIMSAFIFILNDSQEPAIIDFKIMTEGILVGNKFYDYDEIKNFSILYKPNYGIKKLYFEFNSILKHRITIPLYDMNPLLVRENLLKYLPENLERVNESLSEGLADIFKL